MNYVHHFATCAGWESGDMDDCNCFDPPPWLIRKEPGSSYPWRIFRRDTALHYVPLMRASTWEAAFQMVQQMIWLRKNAMHNQRVSDELGESNA